MHFTMQNDNLFSNTYMKIFFFGSTNFSLYMSVDTSSPHNGHQVYLSPSSLYSKAAKPWLMAYLFPEAFIQGQFVT